MSGRGSSHGRQVHDVIVVFTLGQLERSKGQTKVSPKWKRVFGGGEICMTLYSILVKLERFLMPDANNRIILYIL